MKQSEAWVIQVRSDFATAEKVFEEKDASTYCQAIAKYQQTVEKSVKVMVAAVIDVGVPINPVTRSHLLTGEIQTLRLLRRAIDNTSIETITRLFDRHQAAIEQLSRWAPKWPETGQPFQRNTEYPYEVPEGWSAPAAITAFTLEEVKQARQTAWVFHRKAIDFARAVRSARR